MKQWPGGDETLPCDELLKPLHDAMTFAYRLHRQNFLKDIPYSGYDIGRREKEAMLSPDQLFKAESMKWAEEQHDTPAYQQILHVAFLLGLEQGRRIQRKEQRQDA